MQELNKYNELGRPLTTEEVDGNWDSIAAAIASLENGGLQIVGINLLENEAGAFLQFVDAEGDTVAQIPFPAGLQTAGEWISGASYTTRDIVTFEGGTFLCSVAHLASGDEIWDDLDLGRWVQLGSSGAASIGFQNMGSGMVSDTVQDALLELFSLIQGVSVNAGAVAYDSTDSGLLATSVQGAIDEVMQAVSDLQDGGSGGSGTDDQTAAEVPFTPVSGTTATNVQDALADAFEAIAAQSGGGAVSANDVTFTAAGITATNVQDAIIEVKNAIPSGGGGTDDQTAAEVPFTPESGISSTNVQDAIVEVKALIGGGSDSAAGVSYDSTSDTYLSGQTDVQGAIARADTELVQIHSDISSVEDLVNALDANSISAAGIGSYSKVYDALADLLARVEALENA